MDKALSHVESAPGTMPDGKERAAKPEVRFSLWQTLGMNFSITCTPLSIGAQLALIIGLGGSPFYIWGFFVAAIFQLITCVALAEVASAIPHSSGPAYWVQHLAPENWSLFFGYLVGWTTNGFWWFLTVANCLYLAQFTVGLAEALNPGYTPDPWHSYMVYIGYVTILFVINLPGLFKAVLHCMTSGVIVINLSFLFILITLLVRATPKPSAREVFVQVVNESGWSSEGVVFCIALIPGVVGVFAFDSVTHITEEVTQPSKQVPQVMIGSATISAISGLVMTIVYSFSITRPANLLQPFAQQPLLQLIYDTCRSTALTGIATSGIIISFFLASVGGFTSWNRLYWSLSREGVLPFSRTMSKLTTRDKLPLNALYANYILTVALGAVQLGSLTALNAIIGGGLICMTTSYSMTLGLALWRGRSFLPADRWLNLGRLGPVLQIISVLWGCFISVWLCFPLMMPVTLAYMNWASVVFVGLVVCTLIYWVMIFRWRHENQ
ncbi:hypothetical protein BDV24DRAFT_155099 [Aspergillus arachidicola]|uniref:Amino acid permease n=1 Tax=Aspergillus arachidicola TaxID=656916 RepID=A0A5N6XYI6_9EURO|nr:hypothetical protein BDV24DRAFT_155099 [Aspergillus arachidicola]